METIKNKEIKAGFDSEGIFCQKIGDSWLGQEIFCAKLGNGPKNLLFLCDYSSLCWEIGDAMTAWGRGLAAGNGKNPFFNIKEFFSYHTLYLIPRPNPDGVDIVNGIFTANNPFEERMKKMNCSGDFSGWRSNVRGVDLSLNHDGDWEKAKKITASVGPSARGYCGEYPESERESAALSRFLLRIPFDFVFIFSRGEQDGLSCTYRENFVKNSAKSGKIISKYFGIPIFTDDRLKFSTLRSWIMGGLGIPCAELILSDQMMTNIREIFSVCGVVAS